MAFQLTLHKEKSRKINWLLWNTLKNSQRFAFIGNSKLEHIILNPEETVDTISDYFQIQDKEVEAGEQSLKFYSYVVLNKYLGVSAIKRWSAEVGHLKSEDVIISADVDEVLISLFNVNINQRY